MSKYDLRLACDTIYFGLQVDDVTFQYFLDEIKNYLFFPLFVNLEHSRSKWYCSEAINEGEGFYLFFKPRQNLLNDYATCQISGKFFREKKHEDSLKQIFSMFGEVIRVQRIDVCLDVMWEDLPNEVDDLTLSLGFPVPQYSLNWKNVKLPFETYGRWSSGVIFTNMIACGKGDLRLRVYDKSLDIFEKYHLTYSEYYGFEKEFDKVYRIEYQMRGKSLKEFLSNASDVGVDITDIDELCGSIISCLFWKFEFLYVDDIENPFYISTSCKRKSTLEGRLVFHKNKHNFHYAQICSILDEIKEVEDANRQICKNIRGYAKDETEKLKSVFDFNCHRFERELYDDMIRNMIFDEVG